MSLPLVIIKITDKFDKQFSKIDRASQRRISLELEKLTSNRYAGEKLVRDLKGYYSLHCDDFRVIYHVDDSDEVILLAVGHRNRIYANVHRCVQIARN